MLVNFAIFLKKNSNKTERCIQAFDIFLTVLVSDVISKTGRFLSKRAFPREEKLKTLMGKQKRISELCSTQKRGKICESIFWQHQFMTFEWDFLLAVHWNYTSFYMYSICTGTVVASWHKQIDSWGICGFFGLFTKDIRFFGVEDIITWKLLF